MVKYKYFTIDDCIDGITITEIEPIKLKKINILGFYGEAYRDLVRNTATNIRFDTFISENSITDNRADDSFIAYLSRVILRELKNIKADIRLPVITTGRRYGKPIEYLDKYEDSIDITTKVLDYRIEYLSSTTVRVLIARGHRIPNILGLLNVIVIPVDIDLSIYGMTVRNGEIIKSKQCIALCAKSMHLIRRYFADKLQEHVKNGRIYTDDYLNEYATYILENGFFRKGDIPVDVNEEVQLATLIDKDYLNAIIHVHGLLTRLYNPKFTKIDNTITVSYKIFGSDKKEKVNFLKINKEIVFALTHKLIECRYQTDTRYNITKYKLDSRGVTVELMNGVSLEC